MPFSRPVLLASALLLCTPALLAQARFDLPGPKIEIRVTRAGVSLPIGVVPNLQPGDQLWLHPDFPADQSAHYLLIAAFLRGTTNPPPDDWFIRIETWQRHVREEGANVTVPADAQQAILFLAPETGGDFSTLRSAVKGRPGVFVRASQDLIEAGFEQGRIEKYIAALKLVPPGDPKLLQEHSDLLGRTLALRPNPECMKRDPSQLYTCLTQVGTQTLLDDGHALTMAEALSTGAGSDFINAASYTPLAGAGSYSSYVGAIVDLVRLTSGLHTAKYQYIPAIAFPPENAAATALDLRLNSPPSFHNPKSVIVIGLPAVRKSVPPPLRPVDASHVSCLLDPKLVLPIDGAPLVFSTAFAHDLSLEIPLPGGRTESTPLVADAYLGGLVVAPSQSPRRELPAPTPNPPARAETKPTALVAEPADPPVTVLGTVSGKWGFDPFTGPAIAVQRLPGSGWRVLPLAGEPASSGKDPLIVGRPNHLQLTSTGTACVESVHLEPGDLHVDWKIAGTKPEPPVPAAAGTRSPAKLPARLPAPLPVEVNLSLPPDTQPGAIHFGVHQFGVPAPALVSATTFVEPARMDALQLHLGDTTVLLTGKNLDQVKSITLRDQTYTPAAGPAAGDSGKALLASLSATTSPPSFKPAEKLTAQVQLRDGRSLPIAVTLLAPRPAVTLLSRHISAVGTSPIAMANTSDLPLGAQLTFSLKAAAPFPRSGKVEIAAVPIAPTAMSATDQPLATTDSPADAPLQTALSVAVGSLVLQDAHTILATFDPLKTFGPSTFGPFRFRPVAADGTAGDWAPLVSVVRLPTFNSLLCPVDPAAPCTLSGSALYLVDSLSLDADFTTPTRVPEGFVDTTLSLPHPPVNVQPATFYLRLRDDPTTANLVTLSVQTDTATPPAARGSHPTLAAPQPNPTAAADPSSQPHQTR
jgi:hypothetical protein